jgi:hypothetical protein
MTYKIDHGRVLFNALRTALIFIAGFLTYEILKTLEAEWNRTHENKEEVHFAKRKSLQFIAIFLVDLIVLYIIAFMFNIHL